MVFWIDCVSSQNNIIVFVVVHKQQQLPPGDLFKQRRNENLKHIQRKPMEIEAKERIVNREGFDALRQALGAPESAVRQQNVFLDDEAGTLRAARVGLRLRFYEEPATKAGTCLVTCKRGHTLSGGVAQAREDEDTVPASAAREALAAADVGGLAAHSAVLAAALRECRGPVRAYGAFVTHREAYPMSSVAALAHATPAEAAAVAPLRAEVDCTTYAFGATAFEVEIEGRSPAQVATARALLVRALDALHVLHHPTTRSKLACLVERVVD